MRGVIWSLLQCLTTFEEKSEALKKDREALLVAQRERDDLRREVGEKEKKLRDESVRLRRHQNASLLNV